MNQQEFNEVITEIRELAAKLLFIVAKLKKLAKKGTTQ